MNVSRKEAVCEMIRVKEGYERNLDEMLSQFPDSPVVRRFRESTCVIDYEAEFVRGFLCRINPQLDSFLRPSGMDVDPARLRRLRKSEPLLDELLVTLDREFFHSFREGELHAIHGDAAQDNFGAVHGKLCLLDREKHYLGAKPQYSLWYLMATAVPDPRERREWDMDNLLASQPDPNDYRRVSFEARYGAVTPDREGAFKEYRKLYDKFDSVQSIIQIARALHGIKGMDPGFAHTLHEYVEGKLPIGLRDVVDNVLHRYIDPRDEVMKGYFHILFPEEATSQTLALDHTYETLNRLERNERWRRRIVSGVRFAGSASGLTLLTLLGFGIYAAVSEKPFRYERGHIATKELPYTYAEDASFELDAVSLDEKVLSFTTDPRHVPTIVFDEGSTSDLVFDIGGGKMLDQRVDVFFGDMLIHSEYVPARDERQLAVEIPWPSYPVPYGHLHVRLTDFTHPPSDPLFDATYIVFPREGSDAVGLRAQFLNCLYRSLDVAVTADVPEISPRSRHVTFSLERGIYLGDDIFANLARAGEEYKDKGDVRDYSRICFMFEINDPVRATLRLSNGLEATLPMYKQSSPMPDHLLASFPEEDREFFRGGRGDGRWHYDAGNVTFDVSRLDMLSLWRGYLSAELYLTTGNSETEFFVAEHSIPIRDAKQFDEMNNVPDITSGVYAPAIEPIRPYSQPQIECEFAGTERFAYVDIASGSELTLSCRNKAPNTVLSGVQMRVVVPELGFTSEAIPVGQIAGDTVVLRKDPERDIVEDLREMEEDLSSIGSITECMRSGSPLIECDIPPSTGSDIERIVRVDPALVRLPIHVPQETVPGFYSIIVEYQALYEDGEAEGDTQRVVTKSIFDSAFQAHRLFGRAPPEEYPISQFLDEVRAHSDSVLCHYSTATLRGGSKGFSRCTQILGMIGDGFDYLRQIREDFPRQTRPGAINIVLNDCGDIPAGAEPVGSSLRWSYSEPYILRSVKFDENPVLYVCPNVPSSYSIVGLNEVIAAQGSEAVALQYSQDTKKWEWKYNPEK